jgi:hypothetical protein
LDDLIVSSYQADPSGKLSAGKSYVVCRVACISNGTQINGTTADASNPTGGFVINGGGGGGVNTTAAINTGTVACAGLMQATLQGDLLLMAGRVMIGVAPQSPAQEMSTATAWMI